MTRIEIDKILNEFNGTEMIKKARIINKDNKNFTLLISTGQVISSFSRVTEFRKFLKEVSKRNNG